MSFNNSNNAENIIEYPTPENYINAQFQNNFDPSPVGPQYKFIKNGVPIANPELYLDKDVDDMDKILEKYIDKVDRDQSDLKRDIVESEKRNEKRIEESNKYSEQREERTNKKLEEIEKRTEKKHDEIKQEILEIKNLIKESIKENKHEIESIANKVDANNKYAASLVVTTAIGITSIIIAVIALLYTIK